jgi:hypothetical protein
MVTRLDRFIKKSETKNIFVYNKTVLATIIYPDRLSDGKNKMAGHSIFGHKYYVRISNVTGYRTFTVLKLSQRLPVSKTFQMVETTLTATR